MSKYQSVDTAVNWSVGLLKAVLKRMKSDSEYKRFKDTFDKMDNSYADFAKKLETILVREIDDKVKKNSIAHRRVYNAFNFNAEDCNAVNLEKAIDRTLFELGLKNDIDKALLELARDPLSSYVSSVSEVSPKRFLGKTTFVYYKDAEGKFNHSKTYSYSR